MRMQICQMEWSRVSMQGGGLPVRTALPFSSASHPGSDASEHSQIGGQENRGESQREVVTKESARSVPVFEVQYSGLLAKLVSMNV